MIEPTIIDNVIKEKQNFFCGDTEHFSQTRDVFSARLQSFIIQRKEYLEAAVIGEIGNNTFDHNFVFDINYPKGVYCNFCCNNKFVVISDYGRGIRDSLLPVVHLISGDMEAVEIAFTRHISGRSPEQRGNGLKFVSETVRQKHWHLFFQSGNGTCSIDKNNILFNESNVSLPGCLAVISFNYG